MRKIARVLSANRSTARWPSLVHESNVLSYQGCPSAALPPLTPLPRRARHLLLPTASLRIPLRFLVWRQCRPVRAVLQQSEGASPTRNVSWWLTRNHNAGECRRGDAGNRGCEAHRFGGSRSDAATPGGDGASARTGPKPPQGPLTKRRKHALGLGRIGRFNQCGD